MSDDVKKSAIRNLLSRTKEFRNRKLFLILNEIGLKKYKKMGEQIDLSEDIIRNITSGRNALFHKGSSFPEETLWSHLFPIVREVTTLVLKNPKCLD